MDPGFTKVKRLFFGTLLLIFSLAKDGSSKSIFLILYTCFIIIYLLKLFIIIPYVAHNEGRTFIYLEHFVGIMAPSTWSDSMATPLGSHPGSDANDCVKHLTFSGVYPSWDGNLQTLCLVLETAGRAGLKKEKGEMDINLSWILIPPPKKKKHVARKEYI